MCAEFVGIWEYYVDGNFVDPQYSHYWKLEWTKSDDLGKWNLHWKPQPHVYGKFIEKNKRICANVMLEIGLMYLYWVFSM